METDGLDVFKSLDFGFTSFEIPSSVEEAKAVKAWTTHDTNLLSSKIFRRDQIWFVEKDKTESSDLFCLAEFKDAEGVKVRNDRSFEKDYIQGKYGAIPYLNYDWED